jgi:hypothetical protein
MPPSGENDAQPASSVPMATVAATFASGEDFNTDDVMAHSPDFGEGATRSFCWRQLPGATGRCDA